MVEEVKWRKPSNSMLGVPVWEHAGIICTGETYKSVVKLTFAKGASLKDPSGLFNASLEGNVRRAIDIHEGDKIDEKAFKALIRAAVALNFRCEPPLAPSALRRDQRALEVSPPRPAGLARGRYLAGLAEQGSKSRLHRFEIEGLGQENRVFEPLALVEPAIAGGECKGNAPRAKRVGQWIAGVPAKIYVEDGAVQLPAGKRKPVGDGTGRAHDFAAELIEPILNQH